MKREETVEEVEKNTEWQRRTPKRKAAGSNPVRGAKSAITANGDGAFLFLRRAGRRIRRLRLERHSSPAFWERALPRLSAKAQEAAEHPEAADGQPGAGDGVEGREVAEKAQGLGREASHQGREDPAPPGVGRIALGEGGDLRYRQQQEEDPEEGRGGQEEVQGEFHQGLLGETLPCQED